MAGLTIRQLIILACLGGLAACEPAVESEQTSAPAAPSVTVAKPLVSNIREWDEFTGRFGAVTTVEVQSRVRGTIEEIGFEDGGLVSAGDVLFVIDKRPFNVALQAALADREAAQADAEFAEREAQRGEELLERNVLSREVVDERRRAAAMARASVAAADARIAQAQLDLDFAEVKTPIDGRISRQFVNAGNLVDSGTILTRVVSIDPIHFYFDASERQYLKYARLSQSGARTSSRTSSNPVWVRLEDEDGFEREGVMDFVDNRINPDTGTIRGRAIFANPDGLIQPGLFGRLRLVGSDPYDAILLPDEAIGSNQDKKYVLVVDDEGTVEYRPITIGSLHEGMRIIKEGLEGQETVVVSGLLRARPGGKVTPQMSELSLDNS